MVVLLAVSGFVGENLYWAASNDMSFRFKVWKTRWAYKLGADLPFPTVDRAIPAGEFVMGSKHGSSEERPPHRVDFDRPFYLAATELSFAQYDFICELNPACDPPDDEGWGRDDRPVINVDWHDAREYTDWLSAMTGVACRLPSEAEWEYGARADTTTEYALPAPGGSDDIADKGLANCHGCDSEWDNDKTAPVGQFDANTWGLHDMHGNVWEWTEDCWHDSYQGAPDDGRAWLEDNGGECGRRVVRGGSWVNLPDYARSAVRYRLTSDFRDFSLGFRVVCSSHICPFLPRLGAFRCRAGGPGRYAIWTRLRDCPPTTVCGPRRGRRDGAGRSRPHGPASPSRRAHSKQGCRPGFAPRCPAPFQLPQM